MSLSFFVVRIVIAILHTNTFFRSWQSLQFLTTTVDVQVYKFNVYAKGDSHAYWHSVEMLRFLVEVHLVVYDSSTGKIVREMRPKQFRFNDLRQKRGAVLKYFGDCPALIDPLLAP